MNCKFGSTLFISLQQEAKDKTSSAELMKWAFKFKMGSAKKYKFDTKDNKSDHKDEQMVDYLPNTELKSEIVNYERFAKLWGMFPDYAKIRVPKLIFRASVDGYNIHNLYEKCG